MLLILAVLVNLVLIIAGAIDVMMRKLDGKDDDDDDNDHDDRLDIPCA